MAKEELLERFRQLPPEAWSGDVTARLVGEVIEFLEGEEHRRLRIRVGQGLLLFLGVLFTLLTAAFLTPPGRGIVHLLGALVSGGLALLCWKGLHSLATDPPPPQRYFRLDAARQEFIGEPGSRLPRHLSLEEIRAFLCFRTTFRADSWPMRAEEEPTEESQTNASEEQPSPAKKGWFVFSWPWAVEWTVHCSYAVTTEDVGYRLLRTEPDMKTSLNLVKALGEICAKPALYLEDKMLSQRLRRQAQEGRFSEELLSKAEPIESWER